MQKLTPEQLRRAIEPATLGFESTDQLEPLEGIVGQKRAVSALDFGLDIQDGGFNIYVAGPPGLGKRTAVEAFIGQLAQRRPPPPDWCYINNFDDPYQPTILSIPAGRARSLRDDMDQLIADARREIPQAFESEQYNARRDEIKTALEQQREAALLKLNDQAAKMGFVVEPSPFGIAMVPLRKGQPLKEGEFQSLPPSEREELQHRHAQLQQELNAMLKNARDMDRAAREKYQALDQQLALYVTGGLIDDLEEKYKDLPEVCKFIAAVKKDILENIELFKSAKGATEASEEMPLPTPWLRELPFHKYRVNLLVDASTRLPGEQGSGSETMGEERGKAQGAPVVVESNPTYNNLFGRIEKETRFGVLFTDHTMIKPGSLHKANGGFLVLPVEDLLRNTFSWDGLKRALRSHTIEIEDLGDRLGFLTTKSLRPQPMPLHVKVVLIGRPLLYGLLHAYDDEFSELFKVKADFDTEMPSTDKNVRDFVSFLTMLCKKEKLASLDAGAVAKILEHAARLAEDQAKLSTHFGAIADVVREAQYWAAQDHAQCIAAPHVQKALDQKVYRSNLIQERIQEMIAKATLLIDTIGETVGQVNGLSVLGVGDYIFGKPSRITAVVGPGREGVVDIERKVELGGAIHSKGVLILSGYLMHRYAQERLLTLNASLVFEQSYEGVEGDSASSAELYALLSALSRVPLKQCIAVTGSVNQHGEIQAIGGVNEKIEGFYDVCLAQGSLTGEQGVILPQSNVQHLMLRQDVIEAVRQGRFHLWAIETIDEGIELLTGIKAGVREPDGSFPEGTVNRAVEERLEQFAGQIKSFAGSNGRLNLSAS